MYRAHDHAPTTQKTDGGRYARVASFAPLSLSHSLSHSLSFFPSFLLSFWPSQNSGEILADKFLQSSVARAAAFAALMLSLSLCVRVSPRLQSKVHVVQRMFECPAAAC